MSATGLATFDDTIHITNIWLKELMERLDTDNRKDAYRALRVTMKALRDRIPNTEVIQLSAQLPMLVRGFFLEGWQPKKAPTDSKTQDEFIAGLSKEFKFTDVRLSDKEIVSEVFGLLRSKISEGEIEDVKSCLPPSIRHLWDEAPVFEYYDQIVPALD